MAARLLIRTLLHRWSLHACGYLPLTADSYLPTVLSFKQQVNDEFVPYYSRNKTAGWTASNSLFAAFFGINDVGNSYYTQNATLNDAIFKVYSSLLDQVRPFQS